ncbi:hypothetical protein ACFQ9X_43855 [Catenulispora yoronensis]
MTGTEQFDFSGTPDGSEVRTVTGGTPTAGEEIPLATNVLASALAVLVGAVPGALPPAGVLEHPASTIPAQAAATHPVVRFIEPALPDDVRAAGYLVAELC